MKNWKFLLNRLIMLLGMIGSFMGATLGYSRILIENLKVNLFTGILAIEGIGLIFTFLLILTTTIDYIKDNKKGRE